MRLETQIDQSAGPNRLSYCIIPLKYHRLCFQPFPLCDMLLIAEEKALPKRQRRRNEKGHQPSE
jgi:hypothetical protein